jgi:Subtilase family
VLALIATGTAAIAIGLSAVPASADQVRHREWWLTSLGVTGAWAASQGSGVTVAVLSDGVDASHADLAGAVTTGPAPAGAPVASGQYFGEQGTPIASLIAGRGHGSAGASGILGVAPEARILSVPVTLPSDDPQLGQSSVAASIPGAIAAGIRYAVNHGATVIDLPIDPGQPGSTGTGGATAAAGGSAAEQAAVRYALAHNVVLVAPAGDDEMAGDAPNYPAAYHGVIAVGAFDSAFNKAAFSSHQSYVTITAAGANVLTAASTGGYATMHSTSAASAVVAGVVALIRSRYPGLSAASVRTALITSTTYRRAGGLAQGSGYGAVNADKAMTVAATLSAPPSDRASAGAQPVQAPAAVSAAPTQGITAQIVRAGELSGGLLLLLLLLIGVYAATGRRRRRPQPAVATEWTQRHGQSRYPHAGAADADRMLELFASPEPGPQRGALREREGWAGTGDEGLFAPSAGRRPAGAPAQDPAPGSAGDAGSWLTHGPASRAVSRHANVSGTPPWEPAAAPAGELPWTAPPGRHAGPRHPLAASAAEQAWPDEQQWPDGRAAAGDEQWPVVQAAPGNFAEPAEFGPAAHEAADQSYGPADWDASGPDWAMYSSPSQPDLERPDRRFSSPAGFSYPPDGGASPADGISEISQPEPRVAPSGLPVRQPRPTRPAAPAPLSPSGSLWEPVEADAATAFGEPSYGGEAQDPGSRPIFVWNPADAPESYPVYPGD